MLALALACYAVPAAAQQPAAKPTPGAVVRVLDIGAGGGFPGLAARILRPDIGLTSVEPRERKAAFLRLVGKPALQLCLRRQA